MPFDRAWAEEQSRADLRIGEPFSRKACDVELLSGQVLGGVDAALYVLLAEYQQLAPSSLGECGRAHRKQQLDVQCADVRSPDHACPHGEATLHREGALAPLLDGGRRGPGARSRRCTRCRRLRSRAGREGELQSRVPNRSVPPSRAQTSSVTQPLSDRRLQLAKRPHQSRTRPSSDSQTRRHARTPSVRPQLRGRTGRCRCSTRPARIRRS